LKDFRYIAIGGFSNILVGIYLKIISNIFSSLFL
jgi:hypothetical protein